MYNSTIPMPLRGCGLIGDQRLDFCRALIKDEFHHQHYPQVNPVVAGVRRLRGGEKIMGSPIAMMNKIAFASVSESEILSAVASSGSSLEFFDLTNIGCFADVDFCSGGDFDQAKREIDAVLSRYGIAFSPWQKIDLPKEWADREGCVRYRFSNGVVHFDVYDCTGAI